MKTKVTLLALAVATLQTVAVAQQTPSKATALHQGGKSEGPSFHPVELAEPTG